MRALLRDAARGAMRGADLELVPGRYVVLSTERDALADFCSLLAGSEPPRSGLVELDGRAPVASPDLRRKLAALLPEKALPPAKTLEASIRKALAARGGAAEGAARLLEQAELSSFANVPLAALGPRDIRSAALALALSHDSAELFVLHEPLTTLLPPPLVLGELDRHTARGAIVLATTASPGDAALLGGAWLCVELGRIRATPGPAPRLGSGPWQELLVETKDALTLLRLLHESVPNLTSELGSPGSLKVSGSALDVTVTELTRVARQHGIEIERIQAAVPPVEALMAARAGFARGAYEAARAAALSPQGRPS
jgi:ABC-type transport system involved in cytochrome c biogenesis ATPase subunit